LLLLFNRATGQQLNFDQYSRNNGLINNEVHCIMQDKRGFMYFGTPSGLSIFDGSAFTNYDLSKGFRHHFISDLKELNDGELFLFTAGDQYYKLVNNKLLPGSLSQKAAVKNLFCDKSGKWYASAFEGLYIFNDGSLKNLPVDRGKTFYGINCIAQWQDSLMIIGRSYESLDIYNCKTWQLVTRSKEKIFVRNIFVDADGNAWISSIGNGIVLLKPASILNKQIVFEKLPSPLNAFSKTEFRAVVQDKEKNLWMAGINNGLIKYNPETGNFMHITIDQGLISNTIFSLYCDRENNIWIGTNRGIQKLVHKNVFIYSSKQGLPAELVLDALPLPDSSIITCGYSGVGYIQHHLKKIIRWQPPLEDEYFTKLLSLQTGYFGLSIRKLVELDISRKKITAKKIYPLPEHFRSMVALNDNILLLGGDSGILIFQNNKTDWLTRKDVDHISSMTIDQNSILWTTSLKNKIVGYKISVHDNKVIADEIYQGQTITDGAQDYVQCIAVHNNFIAYGTSQSGITFLTTNGKNITGKKRIDVSSGLGNNNIYFLTWYNDSVLLAGTGEGIDKIILSRNTDSLSIYDISKFYNISSSVYSAKMDAPGNILLATESGLISIPGIDIEQEVLKKLPITISSIRLLNYPDSIPATNSILKLPYYINNISISFASASFKNEKNIRYTYLLQGSNQANWSNPSASANVELSNLSPGNYHFMVKPVDIYGKPSSSTAIADIIIEPAFWQTWWFYVLLGVLTITGVYFFARRRIQSIQKEAGFKTKIAETEMMALRAQMNPHFIFNCMNIIDGFIINNQKEEAQEFLQKFSKLIRLVLENSQHQLVPLQQDLQALQLYIELERTRFNHHFEYIFKVDEGLIEENYKIPPLLLQPYVENAIVHGLMNKEHGKAELQIIIKKNKDHILAIIEDNGIGRKKSMLLNTQNRKPQQHLGMKVTAKRIELIGQMNNSRVTISVNDLHKEEDTGTRVIISLPDDLKTE